METRNNIKAPLVLQVTYHNKNNPKLAKIEVGNWIDLRAAEDVEMKSGDLAYAGDYIRVTSTPLNGAIFVQNSVAVEGGQEWLDQTNPTEIGLAPNFLTDTAEKVVVSANIADPPKSWHTIYSAKKTDMRRGGRFST